MVRPARRGTVVPAPALTLAGYLALLRCLDGGRLRSAAGAGLAFGAAATFLELSMINAALIVPLALGFAYEGRLRDRLRAALRQWRGWLLAALPLALFVAGFLAGGYGGSARPIRAGTLARFTWEQWSQTIAPMAVGGPWHWFSVPGVYFPVTDPPEWGIWLTEVVAALAVIGSIARSGLRVLVAWSLPVAFTLLCSAALVAGRFHQFGYLSAHSITYAFGAAVPCALAVVLAFPATPPTNGRRATRQRQSGDAHRPRRWTRLAVIAGAAAVLTGAVFSAHGFLDYWTASPTRKYVDTLRGDLDRQPGVSLFDSPLPNDVLAFVESHHSLSDLLPLLGRRVAVDVSQDGHVVDEHGHVVPATFSPAAVVNPDVPGRFCNFPLTGRRELTLRPETVPAANAWYLELQFFQQHASVVRVWAVDEHGRRLTPIGGDEQVIRTTLGVRYLRLATARPAVIHIRSDAEATNVCFTSVRVGAPSAVLGAK